VKWHNDGARAHGLIGKVKTDADIAPGRDFKRRFTIPGRYDYALKDHPDTTGSIIVTGRGGGTVRPPGGGSQTQTHRYRGTLSLSFREDYQFYDGVFASTEGPCNGETGNGSRVVSYDVKLRDVRYTRLGRFESLASASSPGRVGLGHEHVKAKIQREGAPPTIECTTVEGNPLDDPPADEDVGCDNRYTGKPMKMTLMWVRTAAQGRFQFSNDGPPVKTLECGPHFIGGLAIAGPDITTFPFPLNLVPAQLAYDSGNTSPATRSEVGALRAGRAVTIERSIRLNFTADCCNGWSPPGRGVLARIGARFRVRATLRVRLTPA
jgi:hypothetical protein